jgi:hypothetical protein
MFKLNMRKHSSKLQLKTNTIRVLEDGELARIRGGAPSHDPRLCRLAPSAFCVGALPDGGGL